MSPGLQKSIFAAALLLSLPAQAIPVFARRYRTSCTTCHVLPPQLSSFGRAFRANGYRMPAGDPDTDAQDVPLGAPEWEGLFPRAFLPGALPDTPPFAGVIHASISREHLGGVTTEAANAVLALLTGGNLGKRLSWFAAAGVGRDGAGLARAFVSWDRLAGSWLGVRAGYMEPSAVPFSRYTQRLSYSGYLAFEQAQGATGLVLGDSKSALEVFGAGSDPGPLRGLEYSVGVAARDAEGGLAGDGYARVSYKFGGVAAAGDQAGAPGRLSPATAPLDEKTLRIGAFGYRATLNGPDQRPRGVRAGGDMELIYRRVDLFASGWLGFDRASSSAPDAIVSSFLAGGGVRPWPWLMLLARYEAAVTSGAPSQRRVVGTIRAALQQNVALSTDLCLEMPDANVVDLAGSLFVAF